jgi:hypothetical protein
MAKAATQVEGQGAALSHFWSRESGRLYVTNGVRKVRFDDYRVTLDLSDPLHKEVDEMLRTHRSFNVEYHEVVTQKNTRDQQKVMTSQIRQMLSPPTNGEVDEVQKESGMLKLAALFTDEELEKLETYRHNPDVDLLMLEASQNKYIIGVE